MRDKKNDNARFELMKEAIANVEEFLASARALSKEDFLSNKVLCHAVAYNLQCIGENVYKLSRDYINMHPEMDWESIEGLRHLLVHDYYTVSMPMIWEITQTDIPALKEYLQKIPSPEV